MTVIERIEREYHRNHSQPEAFHNICPDLGYTPIPGMSVIQTWFERFNQGDDYLINEMEGKYWVLVLQISETYLRLSNRIYKREGPFKDPFKFVTTDPKYGIKMNLVNWNELHGFSLFDYESGKESSLSLLDGPITSPLVNPRFRLYSISLDRLLVREQSSETSSRIHLIDLDIDSSSCQIKSHIQLELSTADASFVFDESNRSTLAILSNIHEHEGDKSPVYIVQVRDDRLELLRSIDADFDGQFTYYYRLRQEVLSGFSMVTDERKKEPTDIGYWEMKVNEKKTKMEKKFEVKLPEKVVMFGFWSLTFSWSDNLCYIAKSDLNQILSAVYTFNVDTQQATPINLASTKIDEMIVKEKKMTFRLGDGVYRVDLK